ncbi:MAG: hypothetical protein QW567_00170 [Candidatus Hadarchaeales archaeon]
MRVVWCRSIEDVVTVASAHGWIFHLQRGDRHYYYIYAGVESEILCIAVQTNTSIAGKYVSMGDEGEMKSSDKPIMPACARVVEVARDEKFEEMIASSG